MSDINLVTSTEQDDALVDMGVRDYGLEIGCTPQDVVEFMVTASTNTRLIRKLDEQWQKLSKEEKEAKLTPQVIPE